MAELKGDVLEVTIFMTFTDGSGRFPYTITENFHRIPSTLLAPTMVSPACGSTFSNFPRTTNFVWKPVAGAVSYIVEVDCFGSCKAGAWCTDIGQVWKIQKPPERGGAGYSLPQIRCMVVDTRQPCP